jgi:amino acid transporter
MGTIGETLPGASAGRVVPVRWWNWVALALSPPLIALIAATFVPDGQPKRARRREGTAAGVSSAIGSLAMACPVCNPLAIPLFGAAGVLSLLAPERGLIALLSIVLLAVTLALRLRTTRTCQIPGPPEHPPRS